jgi:hypothetical protein
METIYGTIYTPTETFLMPLLSGRSICFFFRRCVTTVRRRSIWDHEFRAREVFWSTVKVIVIIRPGKGPDGVYWRWKLFGLLGGKAVAHHPLGYSLRSAVCSSTCRPDPPCTYPNSKPTTNVNTVSYSLLAHTKESLLY